MEVYNTTIYDPSVVSMLRVMAFIPTFSSTFTASASGIKNKLVSSRPPLHFSFHSLGRVYSLRSTISCSAQLQQPEDEYSIIKTVMPVDTDYSSAMWHGNYIRWLEEARVKYLQFRNLPYEQLMQIHRTELPVRDMSIKYSHPARHGDDIKVTVRLGHPINKVRLVILSDFIRIKDNKLVASASVTVVPMDIDSGKLRRKWPSALTHALLGTNSLS